MGYRAFRDLSGVKHEKLGSILVSFANPAKQFEQQAGNSPLQRQPLSTNKQLPPQAQSSNKVDVGNKSTSSTFSGCINDVP